MRLIDADSIDIKKWFVVPADIQRIQAMLDETETVSGITLRELLESTDGSTDCEVWLPDSLASRRGWSVTTGTADALLRRMAGSLARALQCTVHRVSVEENTLIVHLEDA